jgi:hypothetical protein
VGFLKRFRAKWIPVRVKKTRQNSNLSRGVVAHISLQVSHAVMPGQKREARLRAYVPGIDVFVAE